jgi:ribulose-phosphate 3-epimerase
MTEVIPAILTNDPEEFVALVRKLEAAGVERVHLDICDGEFVPTQTISGYEELMRLETSVKFDVHLMVRNPERFVDHWWSCAQADRFIYHVESTDMFGMLAEHAHSHDHRVFAALNPDSPLEKLEAVQSHCDGVQFMTVHPGLQGQSFLADVLPKMTRYHNRHPDMPIMVDGGITPQTAPPCVAAGATSLVSGSFVIKSDSIEGALAQLRQSIS